jgi:type II secretory pathway pseudopilin PulG
MMPRPLSSTAGFTYIAALFMVVVMGIMLGAVGQSMRVIMKREREKELIFRGLQYRDAIERWNKKKPLMRLQKLEDLLKDPRSMDGKKDARLLRQLYKDPVTGGEWKTLPDPPDPIQGIYGVASKSSEEPFKQGNFPEVIKTFEGKKSYSEWEFVYKNTVTAPGGAVSPGKTPLLTLPSFPLSTPEGI